MSTFVLASSNQGKIREFSAMLNQLGIDVRPQDDYGVVDVPETGTTFVENAIIKARNASLHTGLPSLSDDSGIEVDALNGAPGIYSARYAGTGNDEDNNQKLISALAGVEEAERTARYQCVIVYMRHADDPSPIIVQESWEGVIQLDRKGDNGFGYDPYFYLPEHNCTSAELDPVEKNRISHRGKALVKLLELLKERYNYCLS
jgi:XTP/dITP diphosphohydrolase